MGLVHISAGVVRIGQTFCWEYLDWAELVWKWAGTCQNCFGNGCGWSE